ERCSRCEVHAVVSFYGIFDFTAWSQGSEQEKARLQRLFGGWIPAILKRYSPMFNARRGQPPILLIQGTRDELYRGAMEYTHKLKALGAPFQLILLENAPHGMERKDMRSGCSISRTLWNGFVEYWECSDVLPALSVWKADFDPRACVSLWH